MKYIIVSGGTPPSYRLLKRYIDDGYNVIAADSGANVLYTNKIIPKFLIGDFDSIDKEVLEYFKGKVDIEKYPPEKDYTDTELALLKAIENGATEVIFLGCTGSRLDHVIGNMCVLYKAINKGLKAYIVDDNNKITIITKSSKIIGCKGEGFSLFAYNEEVKNLKIEGSKYNLDNYNLKVGDNLTVSNEFLENEVYLKFNSGSLILIRAID